MRLADTFRKVIISAWMPFAACMLYLVYRIVNDIVGSIYPAQQILTLSIHIGVLAFLLLLALGIAVTLAIYFLLHRRWRQFLWRIFLISAGFYIMLTVDRPWSVYARKHLPKFIEIRVAGPNLAILGDEEITAPDVLTFRTKQFFRHIKLQKAVFVCEADIQSSDFAHNFAFPCLSAGIWRFAFSMPSGDSTRGNIKEIPFYVASESDFKSAGNNKGVIIEARIKATIATVKLSADGTPSFSTDFDPFEHSPEKSSFSSTEESVLGEGRGAEFTVAIVLADMGCRLSDITRTIRRLHESGYKDVVLYFV